MAKPNTSCVVLGIDPGTVNLAACVFLVSPEDGSIRFLSGMVHAVGRNAANCHEFANAAFEMLEIEGELAEVPAHQRYACIEAQQVGRQLNESHVRNNTYVEASVTTRLVALMDTKKILVFTPSAVKRSLGLCTSGYHSNKMAAMLHAQKKCIGFSELGNAASDHYADCFCLVDYALKLGFAFAETKYSVAKSID